MAWEKSCSSMQTVQWSRRRVGSGWTERYDGRGFIGSSCDDDGALLLGMLGMPILLCMGEIVTVSLFRCTD